MNFDATPDCEDGQPFAESIIINFNCKLIHKDHSLHGGQDSSVSWKLQNDGEEVPHLQWYNRRRGSI